jgi:hypothetical protein
LKSVLGNFGFLAAQSRITLLQSMFEDPLVSL